MSNRKNRRNKKSSSNSVATAAEQDEDYYPLGEDEEDVTSTNRSVASDHSSITSDGRGLPANIKKQLFVDIEARGGLDYCDLAALCNDKDGVYGAPSSTLRQKIQNQRTRWKTSQKQD